jgi:hypothetical protein
MHALPSTPTNPWRWDKTRPLIGGVITSTITELVIHLAIFSLWRSRSLQPSAS